MRVLIIDDHTLIRLGTSYLLREGDGEMQVDEAQNLEDGLAKASDHHYDLLILPLFDDGGFEMLESIKREGPQLPVIIVSTYTDDSYAVRALSLGADGYLGKGCAPAELKDAVRKVGSGGKYVCEHHMEALVTELRNNLLPPGQVSHKTPLSPREREVAELLVAGSSNKEIAWKLGLNVKTVSTYKMRIFEKLQVRNQVELVRFALAHKWPAATGLSAGRR